MTLKKLLLLLSVSAALFFSACGTETKINNAVYSFKDSLGRTVEVSSFDKTAVISGSLAEIWQLAGGELYGITNDAYDGHALDIPDDVKNYGDVKNPSVESMVADGVDFAIMSGGIANQIKLEEVLSSSGITTAYFDVENFEDYLFALKICTEITGRDDLYMQNGESVRDRVEGSIQRAQEKEGQQILLLRAFSSGVNAKGSDNMTGRMLSDLGCVNIADSETSLLENLSLEAILLADPDFIFITTMGDEAAAVEQYENTLAVNPAWQELTAVKNNRVYILPKDMFHYKPNNRWGEAYEYLEEILFK